MIHLHNFRAYAERLCTINVKVLISEHEGNRSTARTMVMFPSYKDPKLSCLKNNDRIVASVHSVTEEEIE